VFVALALPMTFAPFADSAPIWSSQQPLGRQRRDELSDLQLQAAADQLLDLVTTFNKQTAYYPAYAKEKIRWLGEQTRDGHISIVLLQDISGTSIDRETLMSSGVIDRQPTIVIVQPRFKRMLLEEGTVRAPFTPRLRNNFMLGLVHEVVHLENPHAGNPDNPTDRLKEELRAWWEVNSEVVRPLRALNQPMHSRFVQVDQAFRACGDRQECPLVRSLIFPAAPHK
jgi:hypothetical protein